MMSNKFFVGSLLSVGAFIITLLIGANYISHGNNGLGIIILTIIIIAIPQIAVLLYVIGVDEEKRKERMRRNE